MDGSCGKPSNRLVLVVTAPVCGHAYSASRSSRVLHHGLALFNNGGSIVGSGMVIVPSLVTILCVCYSRVSVRRIDYLHTATGVAVVQMQMLSSRRDRHKIGKHHKQKCIRKHIELGLGPTLTHENYRPRKSLSNSCLYLLEYGNNLERTEVKPLLKFSLKFVLPSVQPCFLIRSR